MLEHAHNPDQGPEVFKPNEATLAAYEARDHMRLYRDSERGSPESDEALLAANACFETVVHLTEPQLFRNIMHRTGFNSQDSVEISQRTYIRAYGSIHKFRGTETQVSSWLHRIAFNQLSTYYKQLAKRKGDIPLSTVITDDSWVSEQQDEGYEDRLVDTRNESDPTHWIDHEEIKEELELVLAAIRNLNPKHRAVVELRWFYDMAHEQIADKVGVTVSNSKIISMRVREKLQKLRAKNRPEADED